MRSSNVFFNANAKASAGGFITPVSMPYRIYTPFAKPVEALIDVEIPKAGRWYAHVRYLVTPDGQRKLAERVKHYHPFGPFDVVLEGHSFVCGTNQEPGAEFRWDVLAVDLQAGRIPLKLRMTDLAGPDCIILTRTPGYQPELCDCTGPLWLRFKVLEGTRVPFYIHCRCVFSSYESKKPLEPGTLFKGVVATTDEDIVKLRGDPKALLNAGEWSPWIKTFEGKKADWYTHAEFMSVASKPDAATRRHGVDQIKVAWQAATRADEAFLVREGIEDSGAGRGIHILMPHSRGGEGLRRGTMGFTEWADERLGLVTNLGVRAGEGPRKIRVYTSINATVPRDLDASLESCRLLGFNGVDCAQQGLVDPASLWARIQVNGFTWTAAHHLSPAYEVKWFDAPTNAPAGKTLLQAMDQYLYDKSAERIHRLWDGRPEVQRQMLELAILVDEPGPVPNVLILNNSPALKACFHEYLRDNGLAPADFGKTNWCEVEAMGYIARHTKTLDGMLQALGVEVDWIEEGHTRVAAPATPRTPGTPLGHRIQVALSAGPHAATPGQKRLYYWTQRFRSMFTHRFYGAGAQVIRDLSAQGWLRPSIQASPNFQASPIMEAQMGDGGLNLFEWARSGATDCLLMEDWVGDPYRVAFGFSLVDAAARKHGQSLAYLIVVDRRFRTRYLSGLALGARRFVDFTYGPLLKAGPPWGDNREYVKNWGEMLRWTRQVEDDLVQTKARPAQTAILIANSSEINTAFYNALGAEAGVKRGYGGRPLFRRAGVYAALLDAGIPVDLVSEEEIFEDKALDRYKALYVVDTHVAAPVQEAIKAWV